MNSQFLKPFVGALLLLTLAVNSSWAGDEVYNGRKDPNAANGECIKDDDGNCIDEETAEKDNAKKKPKSPVKPKIKVKPNFK